MKRVTTVIAIAMMLAAGMAPARAQGGYDLYQKALLKERAEGNLREAIELYQQIVRGHGGNRPLAAKAQYRTGLLYDRMGRRAEAQRAYQAVVSQYADQADVARQAQAKVTASATPAKGTAVSAVNRGQGLTVRQVWADPNAVSTGTSSPDGQYLSYVDWSTGDLAILEVATGKSRRLTNKGSWSESDEFAEVSVISPDGKQVAYGWWNKAKLYDLRVVGIDGSNPRVFYSSEEVTWAEPVAWSPDGKEIVAVIRRKDRTNQIVSIPLASGSPRTLKALGQRRASGVSLSPDGRYIAYSPPQKEGSAEHDIFLLSTDGGREVALVKHPADDQVLGWVPGSERLLFASDRTGNMGAWAIQVVSGEPQGLPQLVKPDIGQTIWPRGFTREGAFYYTLQINKIDFSMATIDARTGKLSAPPVALNPRFAGVIVQPAWSPDGKYLAYRCMSPVATRVEGGRPTDIVIQALDSGEERVISPKLDSYRGYHWSTDGRSFVVFAYHKGQPGFYRVDASTGDVTLLQSVDLSRKDEPVDMVLTPEGLTVVFIRRDQDTNSFIVLAQTPGVEKERQLARVAGIKPSGVVVRLSQDGRQVALYTRESATGSVVLTVIPAAGGEPREVLRERVPENWASNLQWSPDGQYLFFARRPANEKYKAELWRISAKGGEPQRTGLVVEWLVNFRVHPDGRRIAFIAGKNEHEVWVMENIPKKPRPSR